MTLREAIAETIKRADKDQEFLRLTLARRRAEAEAAEAQARARAGRAEPTAPERPEPQNQRG